MISLQITSYILPFLLSVAVSVALTYFVRRLALRWNVLDRSEADKVRKIHFSPVPLLGGVALFGSFLLVMAGYALFSDRLLGGYLLPKHLIGIAVGGILLMLGGVLDDRFRLSPGKQIVWPILAVLTVIAAGIGVSYVQNPFGGSLRLDQIAITLFTFNDLPYRVILFADIFAFVWLMGMMYTTKFLDGLDGLVSGITVIGGIVLFLLSLTRDVAQPETALISVIVAGSALGFLFFNFHPAKIFLGESGSLWTGFILGTIAILSGAKIATALLILGIPILDVAWVIVRRLIQGKPVTQADRQHLHFRLLDIGLSHRVAVGILYVFTALFGVAALFFTGKEKLISLTVLLIMTLILGSALIVMKKKKGVS